MTIGHDTYNTVRFPFFVCQHGNWDIQANADGYCAAIPNRRGRAFGCHATHFGDAGYTSVTLGVDVRAAVKAAQEASIPAPVALVAQPVQQAQARPALVGFQVADAVTGENIQGDGDPSGLMSFEIMGPIRAEAFLRAHPGFAVMAIQAGDIEEPEFLCEPEAPAMVPQPCQQQQGKAGELPAGFSLEQDSDGDWVLIPPADVTVFSVPGEPCLIGACARDVALSDALAILRDIAEARA